MTQSTLPHALKTAAILACVLFLAFATVISIAGAAETAPVKTVSVEPRITEVPAVTPEVLQWYYDTGIAMPEIAATLDLSGIEIKPNACCTPCLEELAVGLVNDIATSFDRFGEFWGSTSDHSGTPTPAMANAEPTPAPRIVFLDTDSFGGQSIQIELVVVPAGTKAIDGN